MEEVRGQTLLANLSKLLIAILNINLIMAVTSLYSADNSCGNEAVNKGLLLVDQFYSCLINGRNVTSCNNIFLTAPYFPKNDLSKTWDYVIKNKKLFLMNDRYHKDKDFFKRSRKAVTYFNPRNLDNVSEGYLYITIVHSIHDRINSGIYKEIAFPIVKDNRTGEYRIDFRGIKVNGILVDKDNEFVRDFNIIEQLGFTPNK
jgi:hypothetical protein